MDLNAIYGDKEATKRKLDVSLESAIEFYKPVFKENSEKILLDIINKTDFCELNSKYITKEFMYNFIDRLGYFPSYMRGCCLRIKNKNIVITTNKGGNEDYHIFAHELFGHRVCQEFERYVEIGDKVYNRDGVNLSSEDEDKYNLINEGFMELIASDIIRNSKNNIIDKKSLEYLKAHYCSRVITKYLGYEKILQMLVYNKYNLEDEYNSINKNELNKLEKLLNLEFVKRNNKTINKYVNKKISKNLEGFQKRKIR